MAVSSRRARLTARLTPNALDSLSGQSPQGPSLSARDQFDDRAFLRSAVRVLLACLTVAVVIGLSGAAHDVWDAVQWGVDSLLGAVMGLVVARWWVPRAWFDDKPWAAALLIATSITLPLGLAVVLASPLLRHLPFTLNLLLGVLPTVFGTSLVMTALAFLVRQ